MPTLRRCFRVHIEVLLLAVVLQGCSPDGLGVGPSKEKSVGGKRAADVFETPALVQLSKSACTGDLVGLHTAISQGADPNAQGLDGVTPLHWAVNCGSETGVEELLNAGADPSKYAPSIGPLVCVAASMNNGPVLRALLRHGADPNAAYDDKAWSAAETAFAKGLETKDWQAYYALLDNGLDINRAFVGQTIAEFAAKLNQFDKVNELLSRGYSHDMRKIAVRVARSDPETMDETQKVAVRRTAVILRSKGVQIPDSALYAPPTAHQKRSRGLLASSAH